ncbi:hypothetical protein C8J57DRAFT_1706083, partial [Mycena rebaudengoi]
MAKKEKKGKTQMTLLPDDFPPELLTKIFLSLPYESLLRVMAVSVRWNAIVTQHPELTVQMFKKSSEVYVEPGSRTHGLNSYESPEIPKPNQLRLHPAVQETSFILGEGIKNAGFYVGDKHVPLMDLAIANDFASIPMVTTITIQGFNIKIKNMKGIKVIDIFTALAKKFTRRVSERLGDHRFYE